MYLKSRMVHPWLSYNFGTLAHGTPFYAFKFWLLYFIVGFYKINFFSKVAIADCPESAWSDWSPCSNSCLSGTRFRVRSALSNFGNDGTRCQSLVMIKACNENVPCQPNIRALGNGKSVQRRLGEWSECSATCGDKGIRMRCLGHDLIVCPSDMQQIETCNEGILCPSYQPPHCWYGYWKEWSDCSVKCGIGNRMRYRDSRLIGAFAPNGLKNACTDDSYEIQECFGNDPSCNLNCEHWPWGHWSACSATCGNNAIKTRQRFPLSSIEQGNFACNPLIEVSSCQGLPPCEKAYLENKASDTCDFGDWSSWSPCNTLQQKFRFKEPMRNSIIKGCYPELEKVPCDPHKGISEKIYSDAEDPNFLEHTAIGECYNKFNLILACVLSSFFSVCIVAVALLIRKYRRKNLYSRSYFSGNPIAASATDLGSPAGNFGKTITKLLQKKPQKSASAAQSLDENLDDMNDIGTSLDQAFWNDDSSEE